MAFRHRTRFAAGVLPVCFEKGTCLRSTPCAASGNSTRQSKEAVWSGTRKEGWLSSHVWSQGAVQPLDVQMCEHPIVEAGKWPMLGTLAIRWHLMLLSLGPRVLGDLGGMIMSTLPQWCMEGHWARNSHHLIAGANLCARVRAGNGTAVLSGLTFSIPSCTRQIRRASQEFDLALGCRNPLVQTELAAAGLIFAAQHHVYVLCTPSQVAASRSHSSIWCPNIPTQRAKGSFSVCCLPWHASFKQVSKIL